jgi:hypothetical protein
MNTTIDRLEPPRRRRRNGDTTSRGRSGLAGVAVALACALALPAGAQAQQQVPPPPVQEERSPRDGITLSIVPDVTWTNWDDDTGIDNTTLLGGVLSLGFGPFVDLQGYYRRQAGATLEAVGIDDDVLQDELDVESYGAQVVFNLARGDFVPILLGGGGIYEFSPDNADDFRRLKLNFGGGVRATFADWVHGEFTVEGQRYRLDQAALGQLPGDPDADANGSDTRTNLSLRGGLGFMLGGVASPTPARLTEEGMFEERDPTDIAFAVEPFAGLLNFAGATGLDNQELIGARLGANFGPYLGVRGFYWHGVDAFDSFDPLRGYGGEAQFNLSEGPGVVPFLVAGGARLDFQDDFEIPEGAAQPDDQNALILGGGLDFNVGERLRLSAGVRDYITSGDDFAVEEGLDEVETLDDLLHNWQYTGAVKFLVGGGGGFRPAAAQPTAAMPRMAPEMEEMDWRQQEIERRAREMVEEAELTDEERQERLERLDRILETREGLRDERPEDRPEEEELRRDEEAEREDEVQRLRDELIEMLMSDRLPPEDRMRLMRDAAEMRSDMIMVPVPERGEFYVRYGEPAMEGFRPEREGEREEDRAEETRDRPGLELEVREDLQQQIEEALEGRDRQELPEDIVTRQDLEELEERLIRNFEEILWGALEEMRMDRFEDEDFERFEQQREEIDRLRQELQEMREMQEAREQDFLDREQELREREQRAAERRAEEAVPEEVEEAIQPRPEDERDPVIEEDVDIEETVQQAVDEFALSQFRPYVGFGINDPTQAIFGVNADLGPVTEGSNWNLVPEIALGIGEGPTSFMAVANLEYQVPWVFRQENFRFDPMIGVGGGLLNHDDLEAVLNVFYGGVLHLTGGGTQPGDGLSLYLAHQGVDIFSNNRILAGLSFGGGVPGGGGVPTTGPGGTP